MKVIIAGIVLAECLVLGLRAQESAHQPRKKSRPKILLSEFSGVNGFAP
jgi:hypothetical protein